MKIFKLEVWGNFACFTRPETKVERFSYPVMTPSAARGVFDAIYAKPVEFSWRVSKIEVLQPIQYIALRRNEVKDVISERAVVSALKDPEKAPLVLADATRDMIGSDAKGRTQRQTMAIKNVQYVIHANIKPRSGFEGHLTALEQQADRRIKTGKCFYQPYLGCREFIAYFSPANGSYSTIKDSMDLGLMIYDLFDLDDVVIDTARPYISLFRAKLENGVLDIPDWDSPEVLTASRGR